MNNTFSSNPWPGLGSYDDTGRYKFCGRGRATNELYSLISDNNVISLYGRSGIGKTSILKAGVTPLLVRRGYLPVYVRLSHEERKLDETGDNLSYAECIIRCVETRMSENGCVVSEIRNKATSPNSPDFLWSYFCRVAFHAEQGKICTPVIILDQYEEIFQDRREDAALLMRQLYALVDDSRRLPDDLDFDDFRNRFRFVMSFRDDSLYRLEDVINEYNLTAFKENRYLLKALNRDDAQDVITLPGEGLVDSEVSNQILDKVISMSEGNNVDPAILSLLMYGLYEQMIKEGDSVVSRSLVEKSGDDIVHGFYMQGMSNIGGSAINYLEEHLVSSDGRRRAISEADIRSHVTDEELQALINRHILIRLERGKYADYELTHDILCAEAKKDREERTAKERIRKLRKYFLTMIAIVVGLFIVSLLIYKIVRTTQEADSIKILNDSLNLKNKLDELQKDSLKRLTVLYEEERDKYAKALKDKEEQNKLLIAKQKKIEELENTIASYAQKSTIVIKNDVAGELFKNLPFSALSNVVQLKISGNLNGTDFAYLRNLFERKLEHLDLSDAHIVSGGSTYIYGYHTKDDVIGDNLFYRAKSLKSLNLPNNVKSIGESAFWGCSRLDSITIPNSVATIGENAFRGCYELLSITIPDGVKSIGSGAFAECSKINSITIPSSVSSIGENAFEGCELSIINNSSCTSSNHWGAKYCYSEYIDGLFIQDNTVLHYKPNNILIQANVKVPEDVVTIGSRAFANYSNLKSISIPNSVTSIGDYAFSGCWRLSNIIFSPNVKSIGNGAFEHCSALTSIAMPNSLTSIGDHAFYNCKELVSIKIPDSITIIGNGTFEKCTRISEITIPNGVTSIGDKAFYYCIGLTSITIPESVTAIGDHAFDGCKKLKSITIPESVTSIGNGAFAGCSSLTSITIPKNVKSIGPWAFHGCKFYRIINNSSCTSENNWGAELYEEKKIDNNAKESEDGIVIQGNVLLGYKGKATSLKIPDGVGIIGSRAFKDCFSIKSVTIPNSVTSIEESAFENCSDLVSIAIPNSVTSIGESAFYGCSKLTSINLPNNIAEIGNNTFEGCSNLISIIIPNNVTHIGNWVFRHCNSLFSIVLPNGITSIGDETFKDCKSLTSITIPNKVTSIGSGAFAYCENLTSINIPNSVMSIGDYAFYGCNKLSYIQSYIKDIKGVIFVKSKYSAKQISQIPANCMWHVPSGKSQEYKELSWWVPTWRIVEDSVPNKEVKATYSNNILTVDGVQYKMISVKGGTFMMGRTEEIAEAGLGCIVAEGGEEEGDTVYIDPSPHEVTLNDYAIGETEVSQDLWTAIMGYNPSSSKGYNLPVDSISWNECQHFIYKLNTLTGKNFRLPSEAEWEFAARGGNKSNRTPFSGSSNPYEVGWFEENSKDKIHPIKQKKPNELGLYDMSGNVFEFCLDIDRAGDSDIWRRMRGGSVFNIHNIGCVCSSIIGTSQGDKSDGFGFRLAISE